MSVCPSYRRPLLTPSAQPGCRTTTKQGSPKSIHICEPSGAGRNLAASPGNASPPFHPALKKELILQGSFSSALLRPPKSGGVRAGSKEGLFSLVLCEQALQTVQKGQGMATSCNSLKIMGFSRKKKNGELHQADEGCWEKGSWSLSTGEQRAGSWQHRGEAANANTAFGVNIPISCERGGRLQCESGAHSSRVKRDLGDLGCPAERGGSGDPRPMRGRARLSVPCAETATLSVTR